MPAGVVLLNPITISPDELLPRDLWAWLVRWRAQFSCEECRTSFKGDGKVKQRETRLHAHHIDLNPENHRLANGRSLCGKFHQSLHRLLTPITPAAARARSEKAWKTRRASGKINSRFARMTPAEHSAKAIKGAATRARSRRDELGRFM